MAWWGWLLLVWTLLAVVAGTWLGLSIKLADQHEWFRRGRPERRAERRVD